MGVRDFVSRAKLLLKVTDANKFLPASCILLQAAAAARQFDFLSVFLIRKDRGISLYDSLFINFVSASILYIDKYIKERATDRMYLFVKLNKTNQIVPRAFSCFISVPIAQSLNLGTICINNYCLGLEIITRIRETVHKSHTSFGLTVLRQLFQYFFIASVQLHMWSRVEPFIGDIGNRR